MTVKPVVVDGKTYIPVHPAPESANKTNAIVPKTNGTVNTFKIGNKTYIPVSVIPKVFRPMFKNKVPAPVVPKSTPVIAINGEHYIPITNETVKHITFDGVTYIPVHKAPETLQINKTIAPKSKGPINTFKIGEKTYIPISVIPKVFRPAFKNKQAPPKQPLPVIKVNG